MRSLVREASRIAIKGGGLCRNLHKPPERQVEMHAERECSVCYCPYTRGSRTPRVLPCRHTFCSECLLALLALAEPDASDLRQLLCPLCRQPAQARREGKEPPFPVDPGAWERAVAEGPREVDGEVKTSVAAALKRGARSWAKSLKKSLCLQRRDHASPDAVCVDMRDMVLMASFHLI